MSGPMRIGVVGVGSLGQHHARVYAALPGAELAVVCDRDAGRAQAVAERHACQSCEHVEDLFGRVDAVSVAVPTVDHAHVATTLIDAGVAVLVEKPITATLAEADALVARAAERGVVLQVGHVERFNPAVAALEAHAGAPRFVEVHRLGSFSSRSLDIDVVLDLMIHDLDIVLHLAGEEPVAVEAVGVPVLTDKVDIANARLRFASGLIANLTASRVSMEKVRKFRVFAPHRYISVDFAARAAQVYRLVDTGGERPEIRIERTEAADEEPLARQLAAFVAAVRDGGRPRVSGEDGRRALALASRVLERIAEGNASLPAQRPESIERLARAPGVG